MSYSDNCCIAFGGFIGFSTTLIHILPPLVCVIWCNQEDASVTNLIYVTYFYDEERCGVEYLDNIFPESLNLTGLQSQVKLPKKAAWKQVSDIIMYMYIALDVVWITLSLLMIYAVFSKKKGKFPSTIYFSWAIIGMALLMEDVIAGLVYGSNMKRVKGFKDWLDLVGATYDNFTDVESETAMIIMRCPSYNLMFFCMKYFCFFVVNCVMVIRVFQASFNISYANDT